jgi:hypothetical protein
MYQVHIETSFLEDFKAMAMDDLPQMLQMERFKKCWKHEQSTKNENM